MKQPLITCLNMVAVVTVFGLAFGVRTITAAEQIAPVPNEDVQVLASGPIHEAFAEAVAVDPEPGIVAPKAPPPFIEEIPPERKPEGDVQWIPGYWAWDDERTDYIWVSGTWRVPPPARQWVPGYWSPVRQGYQWISGYWASVKAEETEYLPEPPESVEVGPSSKAPSRDYTWIPGCWIWHYGRYAWRPGYWAIIHRDWMWVPAHYIWTPRGYVFVSGYWDYPVIRRGDLFAPVFFLRRASLGWAFSFSPRFVIDLNIFDDALFLRIKYHHYYYGDYYAPRYHRMGIYPWFSVHARRVGYDPIYAHQRWKHRNDHGWENRLRKRFRERREHDRLRSARSFGQRTGPDKALISSDAGRRNDVTPLDRAGKSGARDHRFKPLSERKRQEFPQREKEVRVYRNDRQNRETQRRNMPGQKASKEPGLKKEKSSRSRIVDRAHEKTDRKKAPSSWEKTPKPTSDGGSLERRYVRPRSGDMVQKSEDGGQRSEVRRQRSKDKVQRTGSSGGLSEERMQKSDRRQPRKDEGRRRKNGG